MPACLMACRSTACFMGGASSVFCYGVLRRIIGSAPCRVRGSPGALRLARADVGRNAASQHIPRYRPGLLWTIESDGAPVLPSAVRHMPFGTTSPDTLRRSVLSWLFAVPIPRYPPRAVRPPNMSHAAQEPRTRSCFGVLSILRPLCLARADP
jgi:hypothetical protein